MKFNYLAFNHRLLKYLTFIYIFFLHIIFSLTEYSQDNEFLEFKFATAVEFINTTGSTIAPDIDIISRTGEKVIKRRCTPKICGVKAIINSLEATTAAFVRSVNAAGGPPIQCLPADVARAVLDGIQGIPVVCPTTIQDVNITVCGRNVVLNIIRPINSTGILPIIMYFHGGGWELGSEFTHDRLVRQLSSGTNAALVFVNYTRTPEAQFPVAINEAYAATKYIAENAATFNLDATRLAVAGDSVGGNMATVVAMMAKELNGPSIIHQVLFYPVTQACFDTPTYRKFAQCIWLTRAAMMHYWNWYEPNVALRNNPHLSPLRATLNELKGLPPALVITAQNDVLRFEGECYARKLQRAGVPVRGARFLRTIHDFVLLNPLASTPEARGAISLAQATLCQAFNS